MEIIVCGARVEEIDHRPSGRGGGGGSNSGANVKLQPELVS
jgi:hypothetical protein